MLYYCGFDAFLQLNSSTSSNEKPTSSSNVKFLRSLSDLALDHHDKIINAFIGWCSLFLQTANGKIIYLGYSKVQKQNSLTVCSKVPQYIINIECGSKETFLMTLDFQIHKWSGFNFEKTSPEQIFFEQDHQENQPNDLTNGSELTNPSEKLKIERLCIGAEYSCLLTDTGQAYLFDLTETKLIKRLTSKKIHLICSGQEHILLLSEHGEVLSFGRGSRGQLGHGSIADLLDGDALVVETLNGLKCKSIAAGGWHSMALSDIGDVYVWGWNESGQLGFCRDQVKTETSPKLLDISEDDNFFLISAGSRHSMAVSENGILFGWGWNRYQQLGLEPSIVYCDSPTVIPLDEKVSNVCCKFWSSLIETEKDDEENQ